MENLAQYQQVHIQAKVMHVGEAFELRNGGQVQEGVIADTSGHVILNIWEGNIGKIKEGCSYEMKGLMVKEYRGNKSLSMPKENFSIKEIDDIGSLSDSYTGGKISLEIQLIRDVRVFAVEKLDSYCSCVKCNGKVIPDNDDDISECPKCGTMQDTKECKQAIVAQLRLKAKNGDQFCLTAFDGEVLKIAEQPMDKITKRALMKAEGFNMKYNDGIIYYVERH